MKDRGNEMRKFLLVIFTFIYAATVLADDHKVVPGKEVGEFHYIKATNPLNIVAATDKFMASDCGKNWKAQTGANLVLMQLQGSGMSHFFYIGYSDYEKMELGQKLANCAENFEFIQTIGANSHRDLYYNRIGELSYKEEIGPKMQYSLSTICTLRLLKLLNMLKLGAK